MRKDKLTLLKRARAKYISKGFAIRLLKGNPESPLKNSYFGSILCSHNLYQSGRKITTTYCKQRWCAVCNRIRTAKLINGYLPALKQMKSPYFVTLTKRTVSAEDLKSSIDLMEETWRKILRSDANKRRKIRGIRKGECTIRRDSLYHFHFHVIVDGKEAAEWLVEAWLSRLPDVTDPQAQNYKPADNDSLMEMFKYFTKLLVTTKEGNRDFYPSHRMDVIFSSLKGRRTIQPFGGLKPVDENIDDVESQQYDFLLGEDDIWKWADSDWYNLDGVGLTGYVPTDGMKYLAGGNNDRDNE